MKKQSSKSEVPVTSIDQTAEHAPVKVLDADGFEIVGDRDGRVIIHGGEGGEPAGSTMDGIFIGEGRVIGLESKFGPKGTYAFVADEGKVLLGHCAVLDSHFKSGKVTSEDFGKWMYRITYKGDKVGQKTDLEYRDYEIKRKQLPEAEWLIQGKDF